MLHAGEDTPSCWGVVRIFRVLYLALKHAWSAQKRGAVMQNQRAQQGRKQPATLADTVQLLIQGGPKAGSVDCYRRNPAAMFFLACTVGRPAQHCSERHIIPRRRVWQRPASCSVVWQSRSMPQCAHCSAGGTPSRSERKIALGIPEIWYLYARQRLRTSTCVHNPRAPSARRRGPPGPSLCISPGKSPCGDAQAPRQAINVR